MPAWCKIPLAVPPSQLHNITTRNTEGTVRKQHAPANNQLAGCSIMRHIVVLNNGTSFFQPKLFNVYFSSKHWQRWKLWVSFWVLRMSIEYLEYYIGTVFKFLWNAILQYIVLYYYTAPGVCSLCVCVCSLLTAVCALGWVKCRAQILSMGHHTRPHVTSFPLILYYIIYCII